MELSEWIAEKITCKHYLTNYEKNEIATDIQVAISSYEQEHNCKVLVRKAERPDMDNPKNFPKSWGY